MNLVDLEKTFITLDKSHIDEVEHHIQPPLSGAITIPVEFNDSYKGGFSIIVSRNPFNSDGEFTDTAKFATAIAERLVLVNETGRHDSDDGLDMDELHTLDTLLKRIQDSKDWRKLSAQERRAMETVLGAIGSLIQVWEM
jgi:hypothetical protein